MKLDIFGQPTSLTKNATLDSWNKAQLAFLAHGAVTPEHLGNVLQNEPEFALGQAAKGLFCMLLGRREMILAAREALSAAQRGARETRITPREMVFVTALETWVSGDAPQAVQVLEAGLRENPEDTLAMKLSHAVRFVLGDPAGMRRSIERVLPTYGADHPGYGYLLGCHAFALEETGAYETAESTGRRALLSAPDDAWGLHAVAHVYDMTGNAARGLEWLDGREGAWEHCNNFRYHVWWHKALMFLDLGRIDEVLDLYDRHVRADRTDDYRDISNGTAMLMRLELEGVDVGDRWQELADLSAARTMDGCLIFADLHYMLALTGDRRQVDAAQLIARIRRDAQGGSGTACERMAKPGLEAVLGLQAFGDGQFGEAFGHLARARDTMQLAGGSHAQRDVFERVTIDAGLRAGLIDEAGHMLDQRLALRGHREDGYGAARRALIEAARTHSVPAQ
jgi:tetratricopeptide (TPR) repeat protein